MPRFHLVLFNAFSTAVILSEVEIRPKGGSNEHSEVRDLGGKSAAIIGLLAANVDHFTPQNATCVLRDPRVGLSCPPQDDKMVAEGANAREKGFSLGRGSCIAGGEG